MLTSCLKICSFVNHINLLNTMSTTITIAGKYYHHHNTWPTIMTVNNYHTTVYGKTSARGNFRSFSLNREYFPINHGHIDQQYKSTEYYSKSFTTNSYFPIKTCKFSCIEVLPYMVYHPALILFPILLPEFCSIR